VALASSVSVYGDTSSLAGPVGPDHPVSPTDHYARSKVMAEDLVRESGLPHVILRISAVAVAAFLDPPDPWPFQPHQRIELVALEDLVSALGRLPKKEEALGTTLLLAGGSSWQVTGLEYVRRWGEVMEVPLEEMNFQERPGWLHWYDTRRSQDLLAYQQTPLESFLARLREAVQEALA
jgi:nucleoside-diphosphate-sugar epimerase